MTTLDQLFEEEEARRLKEERAKAAAEDAAFAALPKEEQDRIAADRAAKFEALYAAWEEDEDEDEDEDEEDD